MRAIATGNVRVLRFLSCRFILRFFKHRIGRQFLADQLAALDQLLAQYPQLDKDRLAIWGWSNGGSMTLYAMTHSDRFRAWIL